VTNERWQQALSIYEAAAALDEQARLQYIEATAPDLEVANKVLEMLAEIGNEPQPILRELSPGSCLGPYRILSRIGEGGMGVVYRAHDPRLDLDVAIKVLAPEMAADPQARERLRREARAAAALDHPYICKIFEIGEDGGVLFLVMELLTGMTLDQRLRQGRMPLPEALRITGEMAEAIQEAHARRILHRDLKPSNIMRTGQGHVKMMDFGLAKRMTGDRQSSSNPIGAAGSELTVPGMLIGTPGYMSPEQVKGLPLDMRSDVFSFGAILAEMISGQNPFRRPTMLEALSAVLRDSPDFGKDIQGDTTVRGLVVMVRRMLAKDAAERYASIADVRADLTRFAAASDSAAIPEVKPQADRTAVIGRDTELKQLTVQLDEAFAGRGSLVLLGGEAGIGKTHLSSALLNAARARGAFTIQGSCYEMEGSPPYIPFIELLEQSASTLPSETFRYALGDDAPEVAKLMPELRQMFPDIPPALPSPPEQQRRFLFSACRAFVERLARRTPTVALLEDLHWADVPTSLLLQHLAKAAPELPLLIIGTYRHAETEVGLPWANTLESLQRQKLGIWIQLRRLPVTAVEEMLAALSAQKPPKSFARVVFEGTEGIPFFVEEVFRHLAEEGKLFDGQGDFRSTLQVDQLEVPVGVRLVLRRRLAHLSEDARRILTTAAVIGRVFSMQLLEGMERGGPDAVLEAMEEAEHTPAGDRAARPGHL
jgi:serine/threonine protein kinase